MLSIKKKEDQYVGEFYFFFKYFIIFLHRNRSISLDIFAFHYICIINIHFFSVFNSLILEIIKKKDKEKSCSQLICLCLLHVIESDL